MAKSELMGALEQIAREKNIPVEEILSMIEGAVVSSLRKHVGKNADIRATIDRESGQFSAVVVKKVVDVVVEPELELTEADAQKIKKGVKVGDEVVYPAPASDFARFAGKAVKVRVKIAENGQRRFSGILKGLQDDAVAVQVGETLKTFDRKNIDEVRLDDAAAVDFGEE